ncbi:MAG: hypothetical protein FJ276_06095 [Planctomycetes bacterium]|nr:hypothetical protein [Planctomycetota bacterium]
MNRPLIRKYLSESQLLCLSSALVMFAFCWVRVWLVSLFPADRFRTILEQFRDFERFFPVPFEQMFTYPGRIALTYDEFIVVMCVAVWSIGRGSDCVSGELGRGTMEMLLAQPVSRVKLLFTHATVTAAGTALLALASWLGIYAGIHTTRVEQPVAQPMPQPVWPFPMPGSGMVNQLLEHQGPRVPMSDKVDAAVFWPAAANLFAFGFFLTGLSSLASSCDRYRWRTIGVVSAIYVIQLIVKIVGLASDRHAWMQNTTFFSAYAPERFVSVAVHTPQETWSLIQAGEQGHGFMLGPLGCDVLLIGLGLIAYLGAAVIFARRDLPAPV